MALRKLVVYLEKGGVGKTMTAIHTAAGLAKRGHPTLLIDLDPQYQCKQRLGLNSMPAPKMSLADVIMNGWPAGLSDKEKLQSVLIPTKRQNLYLIPGGRDMSALQFELTTHKGQSWRTALKDALSFLDESKMQFVVMDTNPSWTPLSAAAMFWGAELIFPVATGNDELISLPTFQEELTAVLEMREGDLEVVYILPTRFQKTKTEHREIFNYLRKSYPDKICSPISERVRIQECGGRGGTIWEYDPTCPAADEYEEFVRKVLRKREDKK